MTSQPNKLAFNDGWQYAAAPESTDHVRIDKRYGLFINGDFVEPASGKYFETINPATEATLSSVGLAGSEDIDRAVSAARKAYKGSWSKMKAAERGKYIYRIARILQERAREFSVIESMDGGKPIRESRDIDIPLAAAHFFYYAGWADKLAYAFPGRTPSPLGVAGQIIPWNFPLLMAAWKIAPVRDTDCAACGAPDCRTFAEDIVCGSASLQDCLWISAHSTTKRKRGKGGNTMTVNDLVERFALQVVAGDKGLDRRVEDGYCGDLLSEIMGNAPEGCVWLTIQGHQNIVAVAVLRNMSAIIVSGGQTPDEETLQKANQEGIPILLWPDSSYQLAGRLHSIGIGNAGAE